ncbi:MAG TPA: HEAT repeat domain-containing protein, partial [Planctomycetota bacterium]|nr:HEAT repeat domain-containing protein [Planctomycetota bacterium]
LEDPEASVRLAAVEALHRLGAGPVLRAILKKSSGMVRERAIRALGQLRDRDSADDLVGLAESAEPREALAAIEALREIGAPEPAPRVASLEGSPDDLIRAHALGTSVRLAPRGASDRLRRALRDPSGAVRAQAAEAAGELGLRDLALPLRGLLDDPEEGVQVAALHALGELGSRGALQAVLGCGTSENQEVVLAARWTLGQIGTPEDIPALVVRLRDREPEVREESALILAEMGARDAAGAMSRLLEDRSRAVRRAAVEALGRLRAPGAVSALVESLGRDPEGDRTELLSALGAIGGGEAEEALRRELRADDPACRRLAASLLARGGRSEGVGLLLRETGRPRELNALNALRGPAAWKRLAEAPWGTVLRGRRRGLLLQFARTAGLTVELPRAFTRMDDAWFDELLVRRPGPATRALDMLEAILGDRDVRAPFGFVLEEGAVRLLPAEELPAFWSAWWRSREPGPKR